MSEIEYEFGRDAWEVGWSYGHDLTPWPKAVATVRREIGRDMTATERSAFGRGYLRGGADRPADLTMLGEIIGTDYPL